MENNTFADGFSVKEKCEKSYGLYDKNLLLSIDEKNMKVKILPNLTNFEIIIKHLYPQLKFSEFEMLTYIGENQLTDDDINQIRSKVISFLHGAKGIFKSDIIDAIRMVCIQNKFNPLKEYFTNLPKSNTNHIDNWLTTVCGAEDTPINRIIGKRWLISCVKRALQPGCYIEGSLIFYGEQAAGKTWFFKNINPKPEYYCGSNVDISNIQKACQTYQGKFIIEFGELSSISKANLEETKEFLTATHDTYIPKYSNLNVTSPRMKVFGGSTNNPGILNDPTGNRRFWCVKVGVINQELFLQIKDQLWSEAYQAYLQNDCCVLDDQERVMLQANNSKFEADDPLMDHMAVQLDNYNTGLAIDNVMGSSRLLEIARSFDPKTHPQALSKIMIKLGWKREQFTSGAQKGCTCYVRPEQAWN